MNDAPPAVLSERRGRVLVVTINRPDQRNAVNAAVAHGIAAALDELDADAGLSAGVLTGAGKGFCAGMDLKAFGASGSGGPTPSDPRASAMQQALFAGEFPKPVVAAVNGAAVGGGLELVLGSDLVVAADHARFGLPEVKRGLYPAGNGTMIATRIPLALALEMGLTGDLVTAERAAAIGLVNRIVAGGELIAAALDLAGRVAANGPLGVALTKKLMRASVQQGPQHGRATTEETSAVFGSADAKEGAAAFMEKRPPRFVGR